MNAENQPDTAKATPVKTDPEPRPAATTAPAPAAPSAAPVKKKSKLRRPLMLAVPLALVLGGGYFWLSGGRFEETENANFHQARMLIASDLSGRVTDVAAVDDHGITQGDLLFRIDDQPYKIALQQAEAAVAAARVQVTQMKSAYDAAVAQRKLAQTDLDFVQTTARRQSTLTSRGVASAAAQDEADRSLNQAQEAVTAADIGVQSAAAALGGDPSKPIDDHPLVLQAIAARDKAAYTLSQTTVKAPVSGTVYQASSFQNGQYVTAGSPLFSLVATGNAWVDANFKETQLEGLRPGQPATVTFDTYPDAEFKAVVQAIGAGTGSEFSLLPAQNATGNWVKVTQRIPVRLTLDAGQDLSLLRSGMSGTVSVDTGRQTGLERLEDRARTATGKEAPTNSATAETTTAPAQATTQP